MTKKIGRNEPCPCGSGKKYKKCHGSFAAQAVEASQPRPDIAKLLEQVRAQEKIREAQQGRGRAIVSLKHGDRQIVAVKNTVYFSDKWKTFPDFLADYIKQKLDPNWGIAEIVKPLEQRHPIMQWYDAYCRYQQATIPNPGEVANATVTGVVACYLGLAYSLYLLDHNVELQARLIARLKDLSNFQGAFYELIVANILIRAGFELTLEDETDPASKHCEFAAVSRRTNKRYWVEAKMRSVNGVLGKSDKDGGPDGKPLSRLIPHLNQALAKPAADERLIFIDLNSEPGLGPDNKPGWHDTAIRRLERYEANELPAGTTAYLFVTNMALHRRINETPQSVAVPFGLGMSDFNRPGMIRLSDAYRNKQKHIDAFEIGQTFLQYTNFPSTFDGSLPSEAFGGASNRAIIGNTYFFENAAPGGLVGTVTTATVNEAEKQAYIGVTDQNGMTHILTQPLADKELADYKVHPDAYFGQVVSETRKITDPFELFEWLMEANKGKSRDTMLEFFSKAANIEALKALSDHDLLMVYCEALAGSIQGMAAKKPNGSEESGTSGTDP
jgi:SEC-C motif